MKTRAVYDEAKDEWVLNGTKTWATNGGIADWHVIVASVDPSLGTRGQASFVVPPEFKGNAYESDVQRFPHALRDAIGGLENGSMARPAFGDDVIDHYLNYARTEQGLFDKVVTGYERERLFERG